jgi:hypothetical protein
MIRTRIRTATPVKTSVILSAFVLLLGVLVMGYGFFQNDSQVMYLGIFITGVSSWGILMIAFTRQRSRRLTSRSS